MLADFIGCRNIAKFASGFINCQFIDHTTEYYCLIICV
ncbi:hypothetical protein NT01EI_0194 [Edwardsiella ictaluri 93-146]|uniref:Uncharacterized protein n=1 Tax=Edwardsiella ictaluri (strain 93-146) TaxID=634503 RepID=C5BHF9_EDWI9|nr:hypothetical protein NT01EI_0194 [Edwardsiella ictaluri 93-146]